MSKKKKKVAIPEENINSWLHQINEEGKAGVSVDCVIFGYQDAQLSVLCIDSNMPPFIGKKSLLGDLIKQTETLDQAAHRVLKRRTGLSNLYLEQVKAFGHPDRHPLGRVISLAYFTLVTVSDYQIVDTENKHLSWIPIGDLKEMAFDHKEILEASVKMLRRRIRNNPVAFRMLPEKFTLIQLQQVYECILALEMDKRNFRRKLSNMPYIIDLNETQRAVHHRPAKLYRFDQKLYQKLADQGDAAFNI